MALSAQELRIGNYVNFKTSGYYQGEIRTIDHRSCNITPIRSWLGQKTAKFANIDPIPLTEEWLLRFGDAQVSEIPPIEVIVQDRFLFIWKEPYHYWYVVTLGSHEYLTKIEFVHEYQNFIFTLTGEELVLSK